MSCRTHAGFFVKGPKQRNPSPMAVSMSHFAAPKGLAIRDLLAMKGDILPSDHDDFVSTVMSAANRRRVVEHAVRAFRQSKVRHTHPHFKVSGVGLLEAAEDGAWDAVLQRHPFALSGNSIQEQAACMRAVQDEIARRMEELFATMVRTVAIRTQQARAAHDGDAVLVPTFEEVAAAVEMRQAARTDLVPLIDPLPYDYVVGAAST